jgi:transglutaminase/protease-like cytokinesis protein 3
MKKLLGKLLIFIMALVIAACGFIVLCEFNPDMKKAASVASNTLGEYIKSQNEEENTEESAALASSEDNESEKEVFEFLNLTLTDASSAVSSVTVTQIEEKEFSQYQSEWNSSGINNEIVSKVTTPEVNQDLNEDASDDTAYYQITDNMTDYAVTQRNAITLETAEELQDALKDAGMGYLGKDEDFPASYYPYYHMLTDKCKQLYRQIYGNASNYKDTFLPVTTATPEEWNNAYMSVVFDHPELYWLNTEIYTEYDYKGNVVKVTISFYNEELGNISEAKEKFDSAIAVIVEGAKDLKSAYDKEVYIHDKLAQKNTYKKGSMDQSAYSAIVNDETVCAGYSKAFQYLMQKLEIPTYLVVGWGGGLVSGDMHAWNIVKLGDAYYNVDVTWDDQEPINYNYFNLSDTNFHRHIRMYNSQYLPSCNGKKYSKAPKN